MLNQVVIVGRLVKKPEILEKIGKKITQEKYGRKGKNG